MMTVFALYRLKTRDRNSKINLFFFRKVTALTVIYKYIVAHISLITLSSMSDLLIFKLEMVTNTFHLRNNL